MLRMLLVTLKYLEARAEEILQLRIARVRDEDRFEGIVDHLVIGDLIVGICLVERPAV
jgi:hypothetical protein